MSILIYNDDGVSSDSANALLHYFRDENARFVTAADLRKNSWIFDTKLLIVPGGRSLPYYEKLGKAGNNNIISYVGQGGTYWGFCAGAYYACTKTLFSEGLPLELKLPGELHFFEGRAIGPVFADAEFAYGSESGARIVDVIWKDESTHAVYFNGGCYFEHAEAFKNTEILSVYASNKKPAIIACTYGKGRAILSGVHPELSPSTILLSHFRKLERVKS